MRGVRVPQDLNGEDQFVFGLSVSRLAALLLGLLAAYTIFHLSLPAPVQLITAAIAALTGAAIAWIRPEGRSLVHWVVAAIEFKLGQRIHREALPPQVATNGQVSAGNVKMTPRPPRFSVLTGRSRAAEVRRHRSHNFDGPALRKRTD